MITFRVILAFILGIVAGSLVNMGLVKLGMSLVPAPAGVDFNDMESLKASAHLLEFKNYVFPFLAHALGTFAGALAGYLLAPIRKGQIAWIVGFFFLAGGIAASFMIPAPKAFIAADLLLAYLPMAWLAQRLGERLGAALRKGP